ncbi:MAG: glutathione peroxidase, partial [Ginsengibacter sp.]
MKVSKLTGIGISVKLNNEKISPTQSFYSLKAKTTTEEEVEFEKFRGKKILIVNLASQCGFTPQYNQLEEL